MCTCIWQWILMERSKPWGGKGLDPHNRRTSLATQRVCLNLNKKNCFFFNASACLWMCTCIWQWILMERSKPWEGEGLDPHNKRNCFAIQLDFGNLKILFVWNASACLCMCTCVWQWIRIWVFKVIMYIYMYMRVPEVGKNWLTPHLS